MTAAALDPVAAFAIAAPVAAVLLLAAWSKLRDPALFRAAVENYDILPPALVPAFAVALPVAEVLAGAALLWESSRPLGAAAAVGLLALVTGAVVVNLLRGRVEIECGCGGADGQTLSWGLVARNAALAAIAALAAHPTAERELAWLDYLTVAGATLAGLGLYLMIDQLLRNTARLRMMREDG
jgi:hypothetical protein